MDERGFSGRLNPSARVRAVNCNSVIITRYRSMRIPVSIRTNYSKADIRVLVDSGATDNFIKPSFAKRMGLGMKRLERPRKIWNIDNTENKAGRITHCVDLDVQTKGIHKEMRFLVTNTGQEEMVLGYPWLAQYEPKVSWRHATIHEDALPVILRSISPKKEGLVIAKALTIIDKDQIVKQLDQECSIKTTATELAIAAKQYSVKVELPKEYQEFSHLFNEEASYRFPPSRPWDHAIEFKKGTPDAIDCKIYP